MAYMSNFRAGYELHPVVISFREFILRCDYPRVSCRFTFSPIICFRLLPFCREDLPLNDVTGYLDLSFDRAIDFPIEQRKVLSTGWSYQHPLVIFTIL